MTTVAIVHHRVRDFDAWKKVNDTAADIQRAGGVIAQGVFRDEADPNLVTVLHTFETTAKAHAFLENADLKQAMESGGVDPASFRVEFTEEVQFGRL